MGICNGSNGEEARLLDVAGVSGTFKNMIVLPRIAAITGVLTIVSPVTAADREYGEYLSSECATCHRPDAVDTQIPSIAGMNAKDFAAVMKAYRAKDLDNVAMQTVAKRLTDEDIAALAAYFSSLEAVD